MCLFLEMLCSGGLNNSDPFLLLLPIFNLQCGMNLSSFCLMRDTSVSISYHVYFSLRLFLSFCALWVKWSEMIIAHGDTNKNLSNRDKI